jgi:hypothetical protein
MRPEFVLIAVSGTAASLGFAWLVYTFMRDKMGVRHDEDYGVDLTGSGPRGGDSDGDGGDD